MNIELYDGWRALDEAIAWHKAALLFCNCSYPVWLLGLELERRLQQVKRVLGEPVYYEWNARRVAALLIKWAADERVDNLAGLTCPTPFEPSLDLHGSSEYLWRILLNQETEAYEIQCYRLDQANGVVIALKAIDWRKKAQNEQMV